MLLWHGHPRHGNQHALETLLAYNIRDVVNLEPLLIKAYHLKAAQTPFGAALALDSPAASAGPFRAHGPTVDRLRRQYSAFGF